MPTPGLSLVGFLDQADAFEHLKKVCVQPDESDAALTAVWQQAQGQLGAAVQNAGTPAVLPIPNSHLQHVQTLVNNSWASPVFQPPHGQLHGTSFQWVELDPLLAYQTAIYNVRSQRHCGAFTQAPTVDELFNLCLPLAPTPEPLQVFPPPDAEPRALIVKTPNLSIRSFQGGVFDGRYLGVQFGATLPFVHVTRFGGRCFLHNGYHRAYGARLAGATHLPCVFRDVPDLQTVGVMDNGQTIRPATMMSTNPPTLAHYTLGRAMALNLRRVSRILHVSWSEYVIPDE